MYKFRLVPPPDIVHATALPVLPVPLFYVRSFALRYDQERKIPKWVAEHLTSHTIKGEANRKNSKFKPDPSVPSLFSANNDDYWNSGWSRGHLAAAGDHKFSQV